MRIMRNHDYTPILLLSFFSFAARIGVLASTWILFMTRFDVSPILSALMCIFGQGFITIMKPLSNLVFRRYSLLVSQRFGALVGAASCFSLVFINNIVLFLAVVFTTSFSKVAIEATFPRVTHPFLVDDPKFAPKFIGVQQAALLLVSAIIAPLAFAGFVLIPIFIAIGFYIVSYVVTFIFPACGDDGYVQPIDNDSSQEQFNRRFSDIERNENIREHQSKIHQFRRIPSTLLSIDLFICIVAGASATLMPLCFKYISHVSQGMDSMLCCIFGLFATLTGLVFLPALRRRIVMTENQEFKSLVLILSVCLMTSIFYTTFAGIKVGLLCAVINGIAVVTNKSILHQIASRNLTQNEYQKFGCLIMQRDAIARVCAPVVVGVLASVTTIQFAITVLLGIALVFIAITLARVSLIIHGRRFDYRTLKSIEHPVHSARKLQTVRREGNSLVESDPKIAFEFLRRQCLRSGAKSPPHHGFGLRSFSQSITFAFSQKNRGMDPTRRTSRTG